MISFKFKSTSCSIQLYNLQSADFIPCMPSQHFTAYIVLKLPVFDLKRMTDTHILLFCDSKVRGYTQAAVVAV